MTLTVKSCLRNMVYFFTPENSFMAFPNQKTAQFCPPTHPQWVGMLKTVFWIVISIGFSFLISRQH